MVVVVVAAFVVMLVTLVITAAAASAAAAAAITITITAALQLGGHQEVPAVLGQVPNLTALATRAPVCHISALAQHRPRLAQQVLARLVRSTLLFLHAIAGACVWVVADCL